jgi:hypothetical protein
VLLVVSAIAERGGKSFVADNNLKGVSKLHSKDEVISICRERYIIVMEQKRVTSRGLLRLILQHIAGQMLEELMVPPQL